MQVILIKSIQKLGKVGDTVKVANGYGKNYLIPQSLALRATDNNLKQFSIRKKELEEQNIASKNFFFLSITNIVYNMHGTFD